MGAERNLANQHELKQMRMAFERVKYTRGLTLDLANFAQDTVSGFERIYSQIIPLAGEATIKGLLKTVIKDWVPEGESMETLELGFGQEPGKVIHGSHHDEKRVEWQTLENKVVIGIKTISDQRGESVRSWYLRNTEKKPDILTVIAGKLRKSS